LVKEQTSPSSHVQNPPSNPKKNEILSARKTQEQTVDTISVDLSDAEAVDAAITGAQLIPDVLILSAGGTPPSQIGFFASLPIQEITNCHTQNYLTALYPVHSLIRHWLSPACPEVKHTRHVFFICSSAAFVSLPGYVAYTPAKVAMRALADTLRMELKLYGGEDRFKVGIAFPGCFTSEAFLEEVEGKPLLTKEMEGSQGSVEHLVKTKMSTETVAGIILRKLEKGESYITVDFEGAVIFNNMRGASPRYGLGIWDSFLTFLGWIAMGWVVRSFDRMTTKYGKKEGLRL